MASTYSTNLKLQLMATGENSTTWGATTNVNLGTALEEATVGSATVTFSSANVTLTLTDVNTSQAARNLRLNLTGTTGGARNLIVPALNKVFIVYNGCADAVTVKNTTGTGIAVPAGKTLWVYNDGTNVVDVITHLTSLTLASALPVASGGTGITSFGAGIATFLGTPSSANLAAAVTDETGSGSLVFGTSPTLTSPTFVTPALGTPTSGVLTSATGLPLTTGVTGTLPVANGGTGQNTYTNGQLLIGNTTGNTLAKATLTAGSGVAITNGAGSITIAATGSGGTVTSVDVSGGTTGLTTSGGPVTGSGTITFGGTLAATNGGTGITSLGAGVATFLGAPTSTNLAAAVTGETGSGALVFATSPTLVTPALGTPASGVMTNATGLPLTTGVTGTLPTANGGTGITSLGAGIATFLGTPSSANLATAVTDETGSGALVFATSPTLVTPALGTPASGVLTNATGLPLSTGVTGLLAIANGGTGQTSLTSLLENLPITGGAAGEFRLGTFYVKWGSVSITPATDATVTFTNAFPTACTGVFYGQVGTITASNTMAIQSKTGSITAASFIAQIDEYSAGAPARICYWLAVGY